MKKKCKHGTGMSQTCISRKWIMDNSWNSPRKRETLGSLDCKEIKPVNPKGNQLWIVFRRTDTEAEAPILWPPGAKSWLIGKDPDAGKDWRQEEKGATEDEMVGWHHRLNGHEFEQAPGVGERQGSLECQSMGSQRVRLDWMTKLNLGSSSRRFHELI